MPAALLDTNVLFVSVSARNDYHDRAREIVRGIDHGDLPDVMVTNSVVAETLNLTGEKLGPDAANEMLDRLSKGAHFEIDHAPKADFNALDGVTRFRVELRRLEGPLQLCARCSSGGPATYWTRNLTEHLVDSL